MHYLIGFITAVMVLFPASDSGGKSLYQLWMDAYEKYLYQQMYDNLERERNEQAASEEAVLQEMDVEPTVVQTVVETSAETVPETTAAPSTEASEPEPQADTERGQVVSVTPLYQVDGYIPDEAIQTYLYTRLCESGIGWFFPYSVCQIAQESTWNHLAENPNQKDKGLLQYRIEYVPWMDWRNPYQQIDYYVAQMANRAAAGCTVSDMISRHMTSDYGGYNQSYVDAVMQHSNTLVQIR